MMIETMARSATLPIVTCSGSPRERGKAHGEPLRETIAVGRAWWGEAIAAAHGVNPDDYVAGFARGTDFLPAIRR